MLCFEHIYAFFAVYKSILQYSLPIFYPDITKKPVGNLYLLTPEINIILIKIRFITFAYAILITANLIFQLTVA